MSRRSLRDRSSVHDSDDGSDQSSGTLILSGPEIGLSRQAREESEACLVLLHPPGPDIGKRTRLVNPQYVVGRDASADLMINRNAVSRQHSRLFRGEEASWWVEDMGSTNGTFVNEARVNRRRLFDGDQVRFGDAIFKFLTGSNIESAYHEEIYRMTIIDGLTGAYNKRYFLDFLERELARAHRYQQPLSLVMLDLDHFKRINDDLGHLAGDAVLKELSSRIKPRIRREDLFARYGGEEFAVILTGTALDGGVRFGEQVRSLVGERPFLFNNHPIPVTTSLGVSCVYLEPGVAGQSLISRADENLYKAKERGRNRVVPSLVDLGLTP
jgi:two-component system cell cycle response regulator